jgi:hypothetical protein
MFSQAMPAREKRPPEVGEVPEKGLLREGLQ